MTDDKEKTGTPDKDTIAINDPVEVRDWCKALEVDEKTLRAAVKAVGKSAAKVREYLKAGTAKKFTMEQEYKRGKER